MEKTILVWREEDRRCEGPFSENELQEWYKRGTFTSTTRFVLCDGTIKTLADLMILNGSSFPFYFRTVRETVLYDNFVELLVEHRNAIEYIKKQREKIQTMKKKIEELEEKEKEKKIKERLSFEASSLSISPLEAYDFVLNSEYCMSEKERSGCTVLCPSSRSSSYETAVGPSSNCPSCETAMSPESRCPSSETALCQPSSLCETALCQPSSSFETTNYAISSESNTSSCVESTDSFDVSIPMLKSIGYELVDCEQTRSFMDTNEEYGMEWNEESEVRETAKCTGVRETTKCTHCETLREYMEKEIEGLRSEKRALQVETTILSDLLFESSQEKEANNNEKTVESNMMEQTVEGIMEREFMSILEYDEIVREGIKDSEGCGIQKGENVQEEESIPSLPSITSSTSSSSHLINSPISKLLHICTQRDTPMDTACSGCYRLKRMISQYVAYEIRSALCKV